MVTKVEKKEAEMKDRKSGWKVSYTRGTMEISQDKRGG